jgi:hypothetical protein
VLIFHLINPISVFATINHHISNGFYCCGDGKPAGFQGADYGLLKEAGKLGRKRQRQLVLL